VCGITLFVKVYLSFIVLVFLCNSVAQELDAVVK